MIKKIACLALLASLGAARPAADWRAELATYFGDEKTGDFRGAVDFLKGQIDSLSDEDKPVACGMLAYLHGQLGDRKNEYQRLGEYFEKYGAIGLGYHFLPLAARNSVLRYLREWQLRYPWVLKIGFVSPGGPAETTPAANPPETVLLGIEMASDVYYKLTDGDYTLKGGQFHRGFNSVALQAKKLFREPGAFPFVLEFKAGDLIVRRELVIGVQMDYQGILGRSAGAAKNDEFMLEMFFGQELLASSRKTMVSTQDLEIEVPPPSGKYDPFGPGYQNDPKIPNSVPIMAIPAAILEAIKALKKKGEVEPVPPVELKTDIIVAFRRPKARDDVIEVRARVSLGLREMQFLSYSLIGRR
ncbi:MAG TPA: hypothetical protein DIW61_03560 [Candidatus Aminicenantes bacterium]|nr:hypothetical protein [Candidatus Aminicenantes bacterium]